MGKNSVKCAGARAAIYCAPTCAAKSPPSSGNSISNWSRSKPLLKTSKTISNCAQFTISSQERIEAHIFVAFLAYCLHITLRARLRPLAAGLTPRSVLDKFAAIQMLDVKFPTTDGRTLILSRYTEPDTDHKILLEQLTLTLPPQPPPRITAAGQLMH